MLLLLDIGNSETTIGLVAAGVETRRLRLPTDPKATPDLLRAIAAGLLPPAPAGSEARIASVVPDLTESWRDFLDGEKWATRVVSAEDIPIPLAGPRPEEVGIDRLLAAWGARARRGAPVIVCDFGTATTFDAVDSEGAYLGGAIAPGLAIGADALAHRAARLVRVELAAPAGPIGSTTREALQAGLLYGHAAMTEGMVRRFRARLGADTPVVATGGHAERLLDITDVFTEYAPFLVLDALAALPAARRR